MLSYLVPLVVLAGTTYASFCGPAAIPFSFEALPDGQPVLGCARPTCFGWNAEGKPAGSPSTFYRVNKKPDGYFRKNAEIHVRAFGESEKEFFQSQTATCSQSFDSDQCAADTQWVGGIGPMSNVSGQGLALQCCDYDPLLTSQDRGVASVKPGQIVIGGEIHNGERQYAFDFISDVIKNVAADGSISYEVAVRRVPCLPQPASLSATVEKSVYNEIANRFSKRAKFDRKNNKAFQAPLQEFGENSNIPLENLGGDGGRPVVDNQGPGQIISQSERVVLEPTGQETVQVVQAPPPQQGGGETVVQGPFVAEGEVEEVVDAVQGLELPEGQVPEGLVQQPVFQPPVQQPIAPSYGGGSYGGGYGGGYGAGGGGSSLYCFTADTMVTLANGEQKRMDEIKINDWVMSANRSNAIYSPVESWVHRMPEQDAEFLHIHLDGGKNLKITDKHFIYKTQCTKENVALGYYEVNMKSVYAEKVNVGDCLYVHQDGAFVQKKVVKIEKIQERGIYAPMTANGDIIVNDVFASCYNVLNSNIMQNTFFDYARSWSIMSWFSNEKNEIDLPLMTGLVMELMEHVVPAKLLL